MKTIHFEDHGQDFLTWTIDKNGIVVDCQPAQLSVWRGHQVLNKDLKPGDLVMIDDHNDPEGCRIIKYPVEKIEAGAVATKHRNFVPLLVFMFLALFAKSQSNCQIGISTGSHSLCMPGTYQIGESYFSWFSMTGEYATSYTWTTSNGVTVVSESIIVAPTVPGITTYTLTGLTTDSIGNPCIGTATISIETVICDYGTPIVLGIEELQYDPGPGKASYFDLQGNPIDKRTNQLMIEQTGYLRRKIFIFE